MCKKFALGCVAVAVCLLTLQAVADCGCSAGPAVYAPAAPVYSTYYYRPTVTYYTPSSYVSYYPWSPTYTTYYGAAAVYGTPTVWSYPVYYAAPACDCSP